MRVENFATFQNLQRNLWSFMGAYNRQLEFGK